MHKPKSTTIGIVGAGTMGAGIAFLASRSGYQVVLVDAMRAALETARTRIIRDAERVEDPTVVARVAFAGEFAALAGAALVIEAVPEDLALKRRVLASLEEEVSAATLLATNTSALSIADIAQVLRTPGRFLGIHFFNPPAAMELVELVRGPQTSPEALASAQAFVAALKRRGIVAADTAGFIVNRVARPFYLQGLRALDAGVADAASLDALARGAGFPMGPFALMDLIGIDVNAAVSQAIFDRTGAERLRPQPLQARLIDAGQLGRKTAGGFFRYGSDIVPGAPAVVTFPRSGWPEALGLLDPDRVLMPLVERAQRERLVIHEVATIEEARALHLPIVYDAYRFLDGDVRRLSAPAAGIGILGSLQDQSVLEVVESPDGSIPVELLAPLFVAGPQAIAIADIPGRYVGATVASIINEACYACAEGVADAADIDLALELGVRYPRGPFAWLERIGGDRVAAILEQLARVNPAFAPHPSLLAPSEAGFR